jgi:hypothetical protein
MFALAHVVVPLTLTVTAAAFRSIAWKVSGARNACASAHFPKFVLHLSTHLSRTSESHGHQQTYDSSAALPFCSSWMNSPLVVQELQMGGASAKNASKRVTSVDNAMTRA